MEGHKIFHRFTSFSILNGKKEGSEPFYNKPNAKQIYTIRTIKAPKKLLKFLSFAKKGYHSLLMLFFQAIDAEGIWNGIEIDYDLLELEKLI